MNKKNYISLAKKAADLQVNELRKIKKIFNKSFVDAVDAILDCKGKVILAGIGKSGLIARKISATFSSVGVPSFFCDPAQQTWRYGSNRKKGYSFSFFIFWKYPRVNKHVEIRQSFQN